MIISPCHASVNAHSKPSQLAVRQRNELILAYALIPQLSVEALCAGILYWLSYLVKFNFTRAQCPELESDSPDLRIRSPIGQVVFYKRNLTFNCCNYIPHG